MKRFLAVLLVISTLVLLCSTLISCDESDISETETSDTESESAEGSSAHEHSFKEAWVSDENYHWHTCEEENCTEISSKEEHSWNDGEITKEPTEESDGEKTFTCKVCADTKIETVKFEPAASMIMDAQKWEAMLEKLDSDNYTYVMNQNNVSMGVEITYSIKIAGDKALYSQSAMPEIKDQLHEGEEAVENLKNSTLFYLRDFIANFEDFEYDPETGVYKNAKNITVHYDVLYGYAQDFVLSEAAITVDENGYLASVAMIYEQTVWYDPNTPDAFTAEDEYTFSDYGTTVVTAA